MHRNKFESEAYLICTYVQEKSDFGQVITKVINVFNCEKQLFESIENESLDFMTRLKMSKKAIMDIKQYNERNCSNSQLSKPSIDVRGSTDDTPLILAANYGRTEIALLLLEAKANPHIVTKRGDSALMWAAIRNYHEIVTALIPLGVDLDVQDEGYTALSSAVIEGNIEIVEALCKAGADPERIHEDNETILDIITTYKNDRYPDEHLPCVSILLKHHAIIRNPTIFLNLSCHVISEIHKYYFV